MRRDLALEQKFLRGWKDLKVPPRRILLALSGGVDSMVMAEILVKWSRGLKLELAAAYVHHGKSERSVQAQYRKESQSFVRAWAKTQGLKYFTNANAPKLKSESEMREFREGKLRLWAQKFGGSTTAIAFAHHADDLLETRVIRLIRGAGPQGMYAMGFYRAGKLRPLLSFSREEILEYADLRKLSWIEDPSNEEVDVLRNWLRREWLPLLEKERPGALKTLARSLATVSLSPPEEFDIAPYVGLRREVFAAGPTRHSRQVLARYLKALGLKGYAQTHVDEILKRLGSGRENQSFAMLGMRFQVTSGFLWASRV